MTYFALNVQRCLVPDDQQVVVLVHENQVLVPDDQQALVLVPDDQQALVLHPKNKKKANVMVKGQTVLSQVKKKITQEPNPADNTEEIKYHQGTRLQGRQSH
jgi:hypothetical protein